MKKYLVIAAALIFSVYMFGCGKKQATEESQEPITMETMSAMTATNAAVAPEAGAPTAKVEAVTPAASAVNLPPSGSGQPTAQEIQTALKNAGYYAGDIDGKIGSKTKKAIEEFQKANNLKVDAKVGPMTWALLSAHLNAVVQAQPKKR